jgi:hypothetical protein
MARPPVNTGLRLPPSTKAELQAIVEALEDRGEKVRNDDLIGALIRRAFTAIGSAKSLNQLGHEARAHRARARAEGF